jgi:hypothetical protein
MTKTSGREAVYDLCIEFLNMQMEALFPTTDDVALTEAELSEMAYYEALGAYCGECNDNQS